MPALFDATLDFVNVVDGLEPITVATPALGPQPELPVSVAIEHALRKSISVKEAAVSQGRYLSDDTVWTFPVSETNGQAVRPGCTVTDSSGEIWTVLEANIENTMGLWRCVSRNLAVVWGLNQYITILQQQIGKGFSGAAESTLDAGDNWPVYAEGVLAKLQIIDFTRSQQHGKQSGVVKGRAYMQQQILVDNSYRIVDAAGDTWEVEGFMAPNDISQLFTVEIMRRL